MAKAVFGVLIASSLLAAPAYAGPQTAPVVGVLLSSERESYAEAARAFFADLAAQSLTVSRKDLDLDKLDPADLHVDLVLALGSRASARVAGLRDHPPIVHTFVHDPEAAGLLAPGGTAVVGVAGSAPAEGTIALIRALAPDTRRIGVLHHRERSGAYLIELRAAAGRAQMELLPLPVDSGQQIPSLIVEAQTRMDVILAAPDSSLWNAATLKAAVLSSLRVRRPLFGFSGAFTKSGAIASLASEDSSAIGRQAATLAAKILRHEPTPSPSLLPAGDTTSSVNLVVAQRLGLNPPPHLLSSASEVFR